MKIFAISLITALTIVGGIQILKQTTPRQGKGALTTFRDLRIHDYFEMDSNAQAYLNLIKAMGLIKKDGKSEIVLATDIFCIAKNDSGYFPAVFRKGQLLKGLKIVYLVPRELNENVPAEQLPVAHTQKKNHANDVTIAILEQEYPLANFPKTLRLGAGKGEFAKDAYYVRSLQDALFERGYQVPMDGVFSREVRDAVIDFQRKHNLDDDGIVGGETQKELQIGPYRSKEWYENSIFDPIRDQVENFFANKQQKLEPAF